MRQRGIIGDRVYLTLREMTRDERWLALLAVIQRVRLEQTRTTAAKKWRGK